MAILYGVLRGRPDRFKREDDTSTPHLQIRVLEDEWSAVADCRERASPTLAPTSRSGWSIRSPGHPLLASLPARASGFSTVAGNAGHALDYVKAPLFDWTLGRSLPPSGSASSDDLQDLLSLYLDQCKNAGGEIYAFGAKFDRNLHKPIDIEFGNLDGLHGIHDIHLNQGNVGCARRGQRCVSRWRAHPRLPRSVSRSVPRLSDPVHPHRRRRQRRAGCRRHQPDPRRAGPGQGQSRCRSCPAVYIERALINPSGDDTGHEIVVLASLSTTAQTLTSWRLMDKNAPGDTDQCHAGPGQSVPIALDGTGVQLGNQGGNLILQDHTIASGRRGDLHGRGRRPGEPLCPVPPLKLEAWSVIR